MEYYQGQILANAAWGATEPIWDTVKVPLVSFNDKDWDQDFHLWRMDWNKNSIKLFVDDELINTIDLTKAVNPEGVVPRQPFQPPHYLILNLAIGGGKAGIRLRAISHLVMKLITCASIKSSDSNFANQQLRK